MKFSEFVNEVLGIVPSDIYVLVEVKLSRYDDKINPRVQKRFCVYVDGVGNIEALTPQSVIDQLHSVYTKSEDTDFEVVEEGEVASESEKLEMIF